MEKARGKGSEESVTGRAGLSREQPASIVFSCILYMYRYVLLLSCLTSCKVHAVLGCSSGLILRDCGAIYNDRSRRAVREASTALWLRGRRLCKLNSCWRIPMQPHGNYVRTLLIGTTRVISGVHTLLYWAGSSQTASARKEGRNEAMGRPNQ